MIYRSLYEYEYGKVADLHSKAFSDFFLTSLGVGFLRVYYKASLKSNESLALCAIDENGDIQGFCIGCILSKGYHMRLIMKNLFMFSGVAVRIVFTNPGSLIRLYKNLNKQSDPRDMGDYSELLSIAVSPSYEGSGVGKNLIKNFEEVAKTRNCKRIALTTDYFNNQKVLTFYKKSGYEVYYEFISYPNRKMIKLIKYL
jgi:ribosomal protein S18 acetylase RimI-like enzyme